MTSDSEVELEQILGGIIFDLHPHVGIIKTAADIFSEDYGADLSPDAKKLLDAIQQSAEQVNEIIRNLQDYLSKRAGVSPSTPS